MTDELRALPAVEESAAIHVDSVAFSYGDRPVLRSVSLAIPETHLWGLVGRSGSGKTTLIHVISGLFTPAEGTVRIKSRENLNVGRVRGVVFQDDSLLGWLSVLENVLFPNSPNTDAQRTSIAISFLEEVGLSDRMYAMPQELSGGMRRRVEFVRALLADSQYLLMDEPFGLLDALTRRDLWQLCRRLRDHEPRTGLLCTHDPDEALYLCDAVVALRNDGSGMLTTPIIVPPSLRQLSPSRYAAESQHLRDQILASLGE